MVETVVQTWQGGGANVAPNQSNTGVKVFEYIGTGDEHYAIQFLYTQLGVKQNIQWDTTNEYLICQSVFARRKSNISIELTASYAYAPTGQFELTVDPLSQPDRYQWEPIELEIPCDRDTDNNPIVNSAYDPPPNGEPKKITYWRLSIFRFVSFFDFATAKMYCNVTNSDSLQFNQPNGNNVELDPGTVYCNYVRPTRAYTANDTVVPIEILLDIYDTSAINITDPFQLHILDVGSAGYSTSNGSTSKGNFVYNIGDGSQEPTGPIPLNGLGLPIETGRYAVVDANGALQAPVASPHGLPAGATKETTGSANFPAVFLRWKRYESIPLLPLLNPGA